MTLKLTGFWQRFSLAQQYMLASFTVLLCCMAAVGWWISREIEDSVVHETATTTALYMNSFVAPLVQELADREQLDPESIASLDKLVNETPLGRQIVSFKLWSSDGQVVYSANPELIGQRFPLSAGAKDAWSGTVSAHVSELEDEEHQNEQQFGDRLLETYSPIRKQDSDRIVAVAEFYQTVDNLEAQLAHARLLGWLVIGAATLIAYLALAGIVQRGSDTIVRQQRELRAKVRQLTGLLAQNRALGDRVRRAATGTTARNEHFLKRISAELHDGPAQALGLAVLRLDAVIAHTAECDCDKPGLARSSTDLDIVQNSLREALDEIRKLSSGMILPELGDLRLRETVARVIRSHEQRTGTEVGLEMGALNGEASLPVKITIYRFIQEALNNAYRHAGGVGQRVAVRNGDGWLLVEVSDEGPGFDIAHGYVEEGHLGIEGMRQRVESMGGVFGIDSGRGRGTRVSAELPLHPAEGGA